MANVNGGFNPNLDKITEREVVPNFVERLSIGEDFTMPDYLDKNNNHRIIPIGTKLKDGILTNIIRTFDISDIEHLDSIKTTYTRVYAGDMSASISRPIDDDNNILAGYILYRVVQEKTGQDITDCCSYQSDGENGYKYYLEFDTPASNNDIYKAYFYHTN
jgi:hypothetical protein